MIVVLVLFVVMAFVIMAFVVIVVVTGTGILEEVAGGAVGHVHVELHIGFLALGVLEHEDDGDELAFGELLI